MEILILDIFVKFERWTNNRLILKKTFLLQTVVMSCFSLILFVSTSWHSVDVCVLARYNI
jgi:predicted 2-oxoglutarate/Fe(II)-dependent dioxygenase YbiX